MASGPRTPVILEYDANTWAMIYTDGGTFNRINLATSLKSDPHTWTAYGSNPILLAADGGQIRGLGGWKDADGTFRILYDTIGQICYAYGADLTNLTKHSADDTPVFSGQGEGWEKYVRHPGLYKIGSTYHLFYDGRSDAAVGLVGAIGHATSTDCITWVRDANNPILEPTSGWEGSDVNDPQLVVIDGQYLLFYSGYDGRGDPFRHDIGYAVTSEALSSFEKYASNPVVSPTAGAWDADYVDGSTFLQDDTGTYLYFYGSNATVTGVGYATLI